MREHWEQLEKSLGKRPDEAEYPEVPREGSNLYKWFWELNSSCNGEAVSHQEIKAWCENLEFKLHPWEVRAIRAMSDAHLVQLGEIRKSEGA